MCQVKGGEVLKLSAMDVDDQKLVIRNPKSGKEAEVVFIPKKLADRLKDYLKAKGAAGDQRIFPITYTAARVMVKKAGALVGVHLRPHDLSDSAQYQWADDQCWLRERDQHP